MAWTWTARCASNKLLRAFDRIEDFWYHDGDGESQNLAGCRRRRNNAKDAVMTTSGENAADRYAARVDAVLAQRTRLRGPQPPGDKRAGCPADHPLLKADPLRPLGPNLAVIASYIDAEDVIIDVGGGAGRMSLPLALRCREVINVEPSPTMATGFRSNAAGAGISNARII